MEAKEEDKAKYPFKVRHSRVILLKLMLPWLIVLTKPLVSILASLDSQGIADNTIVLFFSDNGGYYNFGGVNEPLRGGKLETYEGGVRVNAVYALAGCFAS